MTYATQRCVAGEKGVKIAMYRSCGRDRRALENGYRCLEARFLVTCDE